MANKWQRHHVSEKASEGRENIGYQRNQKKAIKESVSINRNNGSSWRSAASQENISSSKQQRGMTSKKASIRRGGMAMYVAARVI